ncbi:MAG: S-layer homology domain-containing protein [Syntrophomonas sp.]|nr:S-layer homology domain-containing protein [Syntrophomonas sp.]
MRKRLLATLLCLCMVVTLLPTIAFAATEEAAIQLGASGIAKTDKIYFGNYSNTPVLWRVLDTKTNTNADGLFLLSDALLGTGDYGDVYFDNASPYSNAWQGSDAQTWCNTFETSSLSVNELAAIIETSKDDSTFISSTYSVPFAASTGILSNDQVFFLSAEEAENSNYGFENDGSRIANYGASAGVWWLRSPYAYNDIRAGVVRRGGDVSSDGVDRAWAARPAFNLYLDSVLFTSAAVGGKSSGTVGAAALKSVADNADVTQWKLTLKDSTRSGFAAILNASSSDTVAAGGSVSVDYSGATTGDNEYISAMLVYGSNTVLYYGNIANNLAAGTQAITIPADLAPGRYTLKIFNEQVNGEKKTDYASEFKNIAITVSAADTTAPTLTAGVVNRTGDTAATVKFTSDEAGAYYYAVVDSGAAEPTIDTAGVGAACGTTEQTIAAILTAGAKDIYIVVKDAAGNESNALKIPIPAYVPNSYIITASPASLPFGSAYTGYAQPSAQTVTITNTGNQSITLTQPTATNYDVGALTTTILAKNGDIATFTVAPKTGLGVGTHNETITVSGTNDTSASVTAAFTVQQQGGSGGDTTDYYTLAFDTNGGSSVSSVRRAEYTTVNLSGYTPTKDGYTFTGWYSDKALTEKITSIRLTKNTTIYAGWNRTNHQTGVWDNPFTDVSENDWFYEDVVLCNELGLMRGTSDTTFSPYVTTSRGMIVTILYRIENEPVVSGACPFNDVKAGSYYEKAITWAAANGIVGGYGDAKFGPDDNITREQMAAILYRYAQYKGYDFGVDSDISSYNDAAAVSEGFIAAMRWACGAGIINGSNGNLMPKDGTQRCQAAAMLIRFLNAVEK